MGNVAGVLFLVKGRGREEACTRRSSKYVGASRLGTLKYRMRAYTHDEHWRSRSNVSKLGSPWPLCAARVMPTAAHRTRGTVSFRPARFSSETATCPLACRIVGPRRARQRIPTEPAACRKPGKGSRMALELRLCLGLPSR